MSEESKAEQVMSNLAARILELEPEQGEDEVSVVVEAAAMPTPNATESQSAADFTDRSVTQQYIEAHKNINTRRKTDSDISKFKHFLLNSAGVHQDIEHMTPERLDLLIARFIMESKKEDGCDFEPDSISGIHASLCRYLKDKGYSHNLKTSDNFHHSRTVLLSKRKELKGKGLGNRKRKAEALTDDEIGKLWTAGVLGSDNPEAIINTLYLSFAMGFGTRGRQEHQTMLWGDVELHQTSTNKEYLAFTERATKTRSGVGPSVKDSPKIFAQPGNPRCPVEIYKRYKALRPTLDADSKFYLSVIHSPKTGTWFKKQPMGINKIGNLLKDMATSVGIQGRKTNHSSRHTLAKSLKKAGVQDTEIIKLTGHKTTQGLVPYTSMSIEDQENVSSIISKKITQHSTCTTQQSTTPEPISAACGGEADSSLLSLDTIDHVNWEDIPNEIFLEASSASVTTNVPPENKPCYLSFANANIGNINITYKY